MIDYVSQFITAATVVPLTVSGIIGGIVLHIGTVHTDRHADD